MVEKSTMEGGLGFPSIETFQLIEMIKMVITLHESSTSSDPLLKDSIEIIQIETGLSKSIFEVKCNNIERLILPS